MDYVYAPWREEYIKDTKKKKEKECVFCSIISLSSKDEENFVLYRDDKIVIVMNRYPYTPAHFMIIPKIHIDNIESLDRDIWLHIALFTQKGVALLKSFGAKGVNIGMNLSDVSGAGIPEHIHTHLVPRWAGDTNFITTIAETRVYSSDFNRIYRELKEKSKNIFSV